MKPLKSREHAAEELASMVHELEAHDAKAQQIAESGRQLAHDVLTSHAALLYWQKAPGGVCKAAEVHSAASS